MSAFGVGGGEALNRSTDAPEWLVMAIERVGWDRLIRLQLPGVILHGACDLWLWLCRPAQMTPQCRPEISIPRGLL